MGGASGEGMQGESDQNNAKESIFSLKLGVGVHTYDPWAGEAETKEALRLTGQPA